MFKRIVAVLVCLAMIASTYKPLYAQGFSINQLPVPGSMIDTTPSFVPLILKGLIVHPEDALKFDFLMDTGNSSLKGSALSDEALKIMKYFLTALTIPEDDLWVNLSPYEKQKIVQFNFSQTVMGRDLLAEDYILKQLTASLIYPEKALGKEFWQQVYRKAAKEYGNTQIPVNTFNKVWIVPSEAEVWENQDKVLIVKSHLKVMLEEDYLSLQKNSGTVIARSQNGDEAISKRTSNNSHALASQVIRSVVLPVLEKEVNESQNFAQLRQMYQAMILATWYKKALRKSILNQIYSNKAKIAGIGYKSSVMAGPKGEAISDVELIYQRYIQAFKKGAFNYIKEDRDPLTKQEMPRKYFSGGFSLSSEAMISGRKSGVTSFALALGLLTGSLGQLSFADQKDILTASQTVGTEILVKSQLDNIKPPVPQKRQVNDAAMKILGIELSFGKKKEKIVQPNPQSTFESLPAPVEKKVPEPPKPRTLQDLLSIPDGSLRADDIRAIDEFNDPRALDRLIEIMKTSKERSLRSLSSWAIAKIGGDRAERELITALENQPLDTLSLSIALADLGTEEAKRALEDQEAKLEKGSLRYNRVKIALGRLALAKGKKGDPSVEPDLDLFFEELPKYNKRDTVVESKDGVAFNFYYLGMGEAYQKLGRTEKAIKALVIVIKGAVPADRALVLNEILKMGETALPFVIKYLFESEDRELAEDGRDLLIQMPLATQTLLSLAKPDLPFYYRAANALKLAGWKPTGVLEKLTVNQAMLALDKEHLGLLAEEEIELLELYLYMQGGWEELGLIGPSAEPYLIKALNANRDHDLHDDNEGYVLAIVSALGYVGTEKSVPYLIKLLGDQKSASAFGIEHHRIQTENYDAAVKFSMLRMAQRINIEPLLIQAREDLVERRRKFGEKRHPKMFDELLAELRRPQEALAPYTYTQESLELLKKLRNDEIYTRKAAAIALGKTGNKAVIEPLLIRVMSDLSGYLRIEAAKAIIEIGGYEDEDVLRKILQRQPPDSDELLIHFFPLILKWKHEGYDFKARHIAERTVTQTMAEDGKNGSDIISARLEIKKGEALVKGNDAKEVQTEKTQAQVSSLIDSPGGIDLNSKAMSFKIRNQEKIELQIRDQRLNDVGFLGFRPRIVSIQKVNLPAVFGLNS